MSTFFLLLVFPCILCLYWYRTSNRTKHLLKKSPNYVNGYAGQDNQLKILPPRQPWEYILVLDVEATCVAGTDFNWPNEIIVRTMLATHYMHLFTWTSVGMACCCPDLG